MNFSMMAFQHVAPPKWFITQCANVPKLFVNSHMLNK
jgi:hypothetical protein